VSQTNTKNKPQPSKGNKMNKYELAAVAALGNLNSNLDVYYMGDRHRGGHDYFTVFTHATKKIETFELTDLSGIVAFAKAA
jgi:hypothetical protein